MAADITYLDPLEPISPSSSHSSSCGQRITCDRRFQNSSRPSSAGSSVRTASPRRLSVDTLTSQFDSHTPFEPINTDTPRSTPAEDDEGFIDGTSNDQLNYTTTFDYFPSEGPVSSLEYSSSLLSSSTKFPRSFSDRRRQRQLLSRLQALTDNGSLDTGSSLVLEECHPSSIPSSGSDDDASCSKEQQQQQQQQHSAASETHVGGAGKFSITSNGEYTVVFPRASAIGRRGAVVKRAPRLRRRKDRD